jgi:hypothetical protein
MAYENSGILSRNDKKTEPNHSDHNGNADITCPACGVKTAYWLNAWIKTTKDGTRKFFSLSLKPKDGQKQQAPPPPKQEEGDDVPF